MKKLTKDEIAALSYNDLGAALKERDQAIPQSKADRVAALELFSENQADETGKGDEPTEAEKAEIERRANLTDAEREAEDANVQVNSAKTPEQLGFAKRAGMQSTAPKKSVAMERPYLDSPRDFGIHIEGHLVRFKKGRTPITDHGGVPAAKVLKALKSDSYVADNGAEVVE